MERKINDGVFFPQVSLQIYSIHRNKILLLPSGSVPSFTKTCLEFQSCVKTQVGHTVLSCDKRGHGWVFCVLTAIIVVALIRWNSTIRWLPREMWHAACFFQKNQILEESCYNEKKNKSVCLSGRFEGSTFQLSQGYYTNLAIRPQFSGSKKHVSLRFHSCLKTVQGHTVHFHEKRCQGVCSVSVYYHTYCYPDQWHSNNVRRVPAVSVKEPVSFRKLRYLTKIVVVMRRKMNPCVFLASLRLQLSTFQRRKILILSLGYSSQYPKKVSPRTFRAV